MKKCANCRQLKPFDQFRLGAGVGGRYSYCRACARELDRARSEERAHANRVWVWSYTSERGCTDCGTKDARVLEFDHVNGKEETVALMMRDSLLEDLVEEVTKRCEVVCKNCHAIRTHRRANNYRWRFHQGDFSIYTTDYYATRKKYRTRRSTGADATS